MLWIPLHPLVSLVVRWRAATILPARRPVAARWFARRAQSQGPSPATQRRRRGHLMRHRCHGSRQSRQPLKCQAERSRRAVLINAVLSFFSSPACREVVDLGRARALPQATPSASPRSVPLHAPQPGDAASPAASDPAAPRAVPIPAAVPPQLLALFWGGLWWSWTETNRVNVLADPAPPFDVEPFVQRHKSLLRRKQ